MLADTSAIHAFGATRTRHAADLDTVGALLASARPDDALGPAGATFTRALETAVRSHADRITRLSAIASDAGSVARTTATALADADSGNGRALDTGL